MERLRIGLAGLGMIMILVFAAAAGLGPTRGNTKPMPGETLSALGVAPHSAGFRPAS